MPFPQAWASTSMPERDRRRPRYLATQRRMREILDERHREEDIRSGVVPVIRRRDPYRDVDGRDVDFDDLGRTE